MMLSSRWWFALGGMVVGAATLAAGVGGWNALHRPVRPMDTGVAVLKVDLPWTALDRKAEPLSERKVRLESLKRLHTELLRSPNILSSAALELHRKHPDLLAGKADPEKWLGDSIRIEDLADTSLLTVSMPGESREHQALIVNTIIDEYLTSKHIWFAAASKARFGEAERMLERYRHDLAMKRRALREDKADPEQQAALRDQVGVLEELARRTALVLERLRLDTVEAESIQVVDQARP